MWGYARLDVGGKGLDHKGAGGPTRNGLPVAGRIHRELRVSDQEDRNISLNKGEFIDFGALS